MLQLEKGTMEHFLINWEAISNSSVFLYFYPQKVKYRWRESCTVFFCGYPNFFHRLPQQEIKMAETCQMNWAFNILVFSPVGRYYCIKQVGQEDERRFFCVGVRRPSWNQNSFFNQNMGTSLNCVPALYLKYI